jgi:glycine/D-amino acid oxidase-like deaminating enzyme
MIAQASRIVVVGAGAFGGWTALSLLRRGARVTLVDAWGPANSRSSSGDETRLIRTVYDGKAVYIDLVVRSFELWRDAEARWKRNVFLTTGVLYLFADDDRFAARSLPLLQQRAVVVDTLDRQEAANRFPQICFDDVRVAYFEPGGGVLLARRACELVKESVEREGGAYRQAEAHPGPIKSGRLSHIALENGTTIAGDAFVFACGPWMGTLFPDVVGDGIIATRQEVMYFGTPPADRRFDATSFPGWIDFGAAGRWYGMPGTERRGVKVADDMAGLPIDPSSLDRVVSAEGVARARNYVARRFPALARQPVVETRVCQYEYSPDGDFLVDRHPETDNVWLVGGGSGHGFKMGPAVGEYVARLILDGASTDPEFTYTHFAEGRDRVTGTDRRKLHS